MMLQSFSRDRARMLHRGMRSRSIFNIQLILTGWLDAPTMLRPTMLGSSVAIIWLEIANAGPTMLGYEARLIGVRVVNMNKLKPKNIALRKSIILAVLK